MLAMNVATLASMLLLEQKECLDKNGNVHEDKLTLRTPVSNDGVKRLQAFLTLSGIKSIKVPWAKSSPNNNIVMGKTYLMMVLNREEFEKKGVVTVSEDTFVKLGFKIGSEKTDGSPMPSPSAPPPPSEAKVLKLVHSSTESEFAALEKVSIKYIDQLLDNESTHNLTVEAFKKFLASRCLATAFADFMEPAAKAEPDEVKVEDLK